MSQFITGKILVFVGSIVALGSGEMLTQKWGNFSILEHLPWWIIIVIPVGSMLLDYFIGYFDEKRMNLMQIENEIINRRNLNPWESEKMERLKNIEKVVSPETFKKAYKTYIDEGQVVLDEDPLLNIKK